MTIGKYDGATTAISAARRDHMAVRGRDLAAKGEEAILHTLEESDAAR
jgi:hypothetical protein